MAVKQFVTILSISLLFTINLNAQNRTLDLTSAALEGYIKTHPQEKVYLHTDRSYYAAGETIWFQTYLTAGPLNLPSPLSYPVYVQLIDETEQLIDQKIVLTPNGFGSGLIDLADSLIAGEYTLVGFTKWMRNTGKEFYFRKDISVLGNSTYREERPTISEEIDIQFFPEGGDLIEGIPTKVAFKAIDENGRSIAVDGSVTDNTGLTVSALKTQHAGMGFFYITPQAGKSYSAYLLGLDKSFDLPKVQESGVGMRLIRMNEEQLKLTITAKDNSESQKRLSILVNSRGLVTFSAELDLSGPIAFINIPTSDIPPGISHFTLFDENNNPLLERLFFVKDPTNHLAISADKPAYKRREKVSIKIELDAMITDSLNGIFSMSAYDIGQTIEKEPELNIMTELLLNSDLKGNIENPAYYFDQKNPEATEHLDLVMLTHGWRRFTWQQILNNPEEELPFDFERGLTLKGTTYRAFSQRTQATKISFMNLAEVIPSLVEGETSNDGQFEFKDLTVFEGENLILKGRREKGKKKKEKDDIQFRIDSSYYQAAPFSNYKPGTKNRLLDLEKRFMEQRRIREKIDAAYDFDSTARRLDDVIVEANRLDVTGRPLESTVFGRGTDAIDFTKGPPLGSTNVIQSLVGRLPGLVISSDGNITLRQGGSSRFPLLLLDDIPVQLGLLQSINPNEFYKMVVLRSSAASAKFGAPAFGGVLAFYTKSGAGIFDDTFEKEDGLVDFKLKHSYQLPREFYSPKYDVKIPEHIKPDYRILLHWQPMIFMGDNREATIEFWASDLETTVLVNVQGLLQDGTPVSKVIYFEIEK